MTSNRATQELPMDTSSAVLIVGSGALATLFAARLAAAGNSVVMLTTWPEAVTALRIHGARLVEASDVAHAYPVHVVSDPHQCRGISQALVLVKAWQTARAAAQLAQCLPADGLALSLQNGWGNREQLQEALGASRVATGVTTLGATVLEPGCVRAAGDGPVMLGKHAALQPLAKRLAAAGFTVQHSDDIAGLLWGKLVINAAINPLTALLRVPNGALSEEPLRSLMGRIAEEAAYVGHSLGLRLPFADAAAAALDVTRRTAANRSSMYQDVLHGRPTEVDAINGVVAREAERLSLAAPINQTLWLLMRHIASESIQ